MYPYVDQATLQYHVGCEREWAGRRQLAPSILSKHVWISKQEYGQHRILVRSRWLPPASELASPTH